MSKESTARLKKITQYLSRIQKKCKNNGLWLIAGFDALKEPTDEAQQGPMVKKLFELNDDNKKFLKSK